MNKPGSSRPRPLADVLRKTLGDAFAKQGFASVELVTRWPRDRGGGDRGPFAAGEDPMAAHPRRRRRRRPRARHPAAAGRGPGRDRKSSTCRTSFWSGSTSSSAGRRSARVRLRQAPLSRRAARGRRRPPIPPPRRASRRPCPRSRTRSCAHGARRRLAGAAMEARSMRRDRRRAWRAWPPLPHLRFQDSHLVGANDGGPGRIRPSGTQLNLGVPQ